VSDRLDQAAVCPTVAAPRRIRVDRATGSPSPIAYDTLPVDDPTQRQTDITQAIERLGWKPEVELEAGIERTAEYFRQIL